MGEKKTLLLALALCLAVVGAAHGQWSDAASQRFAVLGIPNAFWCVSKPIWNITQDGKTLAVKWEDYPPNPRFAIYDPGDPGVADDLVLDKETGLVWTRNANPLGTRTWSQALTSAYLHKAGNRMGWRLPKMEELLSLFDPAKDSFPLLPDQHPFVNVQDGQYWTSTVSLEHAGWSWAKHLGMTSLTAANREFSFYVWPVRGGYGTDVIGNK